MELKDYYGAIKDFINYNEFNKDDETALIEIAKCYIELKDFKNSIIYLDKAIKANDNNPDAFLYRGHLYIQMGVKEKGCLDLSKAGELGNEKVYELINNICN